MSAEVLAQFQSISNRFNSAEISFDDACNLLEQLDFNLLSLDEIEVIEQSDWIPDDLYSDIFRSWLENQDSNINKIISYLPSTTAISKDQMLEFLDQIANPSHQTCLIVENIIEKLATGGGNRKFTNPVDLGLITASSPDELQKTPFKLSNLFTGLKTNRFQSMAKPNASFRIDFPPYMRIRPISYTITNAEQMKGPKSWVLQASNGGEWIDISIETNSKSLEQPGQTAVFQITEPISNAYRSFQFVNKELNWMNNYCIVLCSFDISGEIIYVSNKEY